MSLHQQRVIYRRATEAFVFNEDAADDAGFIYDSDLAEFVGGVVRQKDQRPADATLYVSYGSDENANWGDGVLTGSLNNGAVIVDGFLDVTAGSTAHAAYTGNANTPIGATGTVKCIFKPNFATKPSVNGYIWATTGGANESYLLCQSANGSLRMILKDSAGSNLVDATTGAINWVDGQEYEISCDWNVVTGVSKVFLDGVEVASKTTTGTRTDVIADLVVGAYSSGTAGIDGSIKDLVVYSSPQNTASYTPGYTLPSTIYAASNVCLPVFDHGTTGTINAFTSCVTTEAGTPRYIVESEQSGDYYYWTGSAWAVSDETYAQANAISTFNTNIPSFDVDGTRYARVKLLFTDSDSQSSLGDLTLNYTQSEANTDYSYQLNHYIEEDLTVSFLSGDEIIVGSAMPFNQKYFYLGSTVNAVAAEMTVQIYDGGKWVDAVDVVDRTSVGGATLARSGYVSFRPDIDRNAWVRMTRASDITELSDVEIYNFYWAKFKLSAALTPSLILKHIGYRFNSDNELYAEYPNLNSSTLQNSFKSGSTNWDTQAFVAAERIIDDLIERSIIISPGQLLDARKLKSAGVHKTAQIIFAGMGGKRYEEQAAKASGKYKKAMGQKNFFVDLNRDAELNDHERTASSLVLHR